MNGIINWVIHSVFVIMKKCRAWVVDFGNIWGNRKFYQDVIFSSYTMSWYRHLYVLEFCCNVWLRLKIDIWHQLKEKLNPKIEKISLDTKTRLSIKVTQIWITITVVRFFALSIQLIEYIVGIRTVWGFFRRSNKVRNEYWHTHINIYVAWS